MLRKASAITALLAATTATAQDIRPADVQRMDDGLDLLERSVLGALREGPSRDVNVLVEAMRGTGGDLDPAGDWNCRTLKLGGGLPLVAYGNFKCRITEDGDKSWTLEKLTGSQRATGTVFADGTYTGVGFVGDTPSGTYATLPPDENIPVSEPNQTVPVIGWFEQMGPDRARLMQPDPVLESDFDILYLTR